MATLQLLVLLPSLLSAIAIPQPFTRNTIFGDERLKGEIFEDIDSFSDISLLNDGDNPYRLPTDTRPIHYDILWVIDIIRLTYAGTVDIEIEATRAGVNEIILHSNHTDIANNGVSLRLKSTNETIPTTFTIQSEYHFLRVQPNVNLIYNAANPVVYILSINFAAEMRNDMYGIYGSWFRNTYNQSEVSWMATTQYQATAARFAFPCYDEPKFKATFNITIRRPITHKSWSCMQLERTEPAQLVGYEDDFFYRTPIMSTYLLAIIVAEYESLPERNQNNTYEVIARPGAINTNQGVYAFEVGQKLLSAMSEHTGIDFYSIDPKLKMTQAAIPDFGAGAMENFGLLTYREAYLMYDEVHTNSYSKQLIAYILSHEIAHMWFGNLVTNDWWDVLWLNEGFARYYQYFLTHSVEKYMDLATRFITEQMHTALLSDSANNPQPLSNPGVGSPASVSAMFSTISYNKGAAIIRMTEHFMGCEIHRLGLRNYLANRAYETAIPSDLFNELEAAGIAENAFEQYGSNFNFSEYYISWTEQPGHPVLNVHVNHATGDMTITQRRFNINTGYSSIHSHYIVPITFSTASNPDFNDTKPSHVLRDTVTVINRGSVGDEWVIFNKQQTGFYRVNYDDYTWDLITLALKSPVRTTIDEYNRAQIVNDVFQFARSGLMSYRRAFNILSFLENETSYAPWVAAVTGFNWIRNRLQGTTQLAQLENMIAGWAITVMNEIGYSEPANEDFMRSYLRYQLAPFMCNLNVPACRTAALNQFRDLVDNGVEVPADSRNWVYCNGLRQGTEADFNEMWTRFLEHNVYTEKILLLQVLGCTPHATSLDTLLDHIVQENFVIRPQDYTTAWNSAVSGNEANTQIVFNYIQRNLATVINAFNGAATPLSYVSSRLRTEADIVAFQSWVTQNQAALGNSYQAVLNGAETSRESIRWAAEVATDINDYLVNGNDDLTTTTSTAAPTAATSTSARPQLVEPETPDIPDSASISIISFFVISIAVLPNLIL